MKKQPWGIYRELHKRWNSSELARAYFEVRRPGRGTASDWEQGDWYANFDTIEEAQACADQLNNEDASVLCWTCSNCGRLNTDHDLCDCENRESE